MDEENYEKFEISMFISNKDNNVHRNNSFVICLIVIFVIMLVIMIHHIFSIVEIPYCVNEQFQPTELLLHNIKRRSDAFIYAFHFCV